MANIRTDRWKFFAGESMRFEFWICNDTHRTLAQPRLAWELEVAGQVTYAQRAPAEVQPVAATFQGFADLPAPAVTRRTPGRLRLALFDGDRLVHDTAVDLELFPKPAPLRGAVQILGASSGTASRVAQELKLMVGGGSN